MNSAGVTDRRRVNFERVNRVALDNAEAVAKGLLPDGRRCGPEWVARNPNRADRRPGSLKVNLHTGRWADFATVDRGGDLVSLSAFIARTSQLDAAIRLGASLGVDPYE